MTNNTSSDSVKNRSEIILLYDARDTNPNGDPASPNNEPRIDRHTNQAVVTDVRLKRYIRDELYERGYDIFVKAPTQLYENPAENGSPSRDALVRDILKEDLEPEEVIEKIKERATDVRYFGAVFSVDDDIEGLPKNLTGPVQFGYGRSINPVTQNIESKNQTTVVASDKNKEAGTFTKDNRIHYGLISFGGVINENAAENVGLTTKDVQRLDSVIWNAIVNQTNTRSKAGQKPRLYIRVEYEKDNYHIGGLEDAFNLNTEIPTEEIRSPDDYTIDASKFVEALRMNQDKISSIVAKVDWQMRFEVDNETYSNEEFLEQLPVNVIKK